MIHLIAAFWALKGWPPTSKWTYIGLVCGGVLLGIVAMRLVGARPAMMAHYLGILAVLLRGVL